MKVSREPSLDGSMFSYEFNKLAALAFVGMIEPAAAIDDMVLLNDSETRSIGRSVGKDKDFPIVVGRMLLEQIFKPINLGLIDNDFMRSKRSISKDGGSHADQQGLVGNLATELWSRFAVGLHKDLQVLFVRGKLVNSFQIVIAANHFIGHSGSHISQKVGRHFMTQGSTSKEFGWVDLVVIAILGFSQVSQTYNTSVPMCFLGSFKNGFPIVLAVFVVFHLARINVQITQDTHQERRVVKTAFIQGRFDGSLEPLVGIHELRTVSRVVALVKQGRGSPGMLLSSLLNGRRSKGNHNGSCWKQNGQGKLDFGT
mmetsp:Transcript_2132/g.4820  ORF Transcript_2132/g.4820 Transcript_2132/m.4820 type:complete len:313 (-) Transcript_2132:195-1133(-)